jgi:hypothetical protein
VRPARAALVTALLAGLLAAGPVPLAGPARSEERPAISPTRDVDVTYLMVQSDTPDGPRLLRQRLRYAVTAHKLRIDPPTPDLYMIVDLVPHRLETIRDAERMVMEMDAPGAAAGPPNGGAGQAAGASGRAAFRRHGVAQVSGLACTEWETTDAAGEAALVCLTGDGVMLRASGGGRVLLEAAKVVYGPIDPSVFSIPPGYTRFTPPPLSRAVPLQNPPTPPAPRSPAVPSP